MINRMENKRAIINKVDRVESISILVNQSNLLNFGLPKSKNNFEQANFKYDLIL